MIDKDIYDYKTVSEWGTPQFNRAVQNLLDSDVGWKPYGGVSVAITTDGEALFAQAFVKRTSD